MLNHNRLFFILKNKITSKWYYKMVLPIISISKSIQIVFNERPLDFKVFFFNLGVAANIK